jgi:hypothetical protein
MLASGVLVLWLRLSGGWTSGIRPIATYFLVAGALALGFDVLIPGLRNLDSVAGSIVHICGVGMLVGVYAALKTCRVRVAAGVILAYAIFTGIVFVERFDSPPIDVYVAHSGAAELLAAGDNPYASLDLVEGPVDGDIVLRQYFYPPVTLVWYTAFHKALGDVRYGGLAAWLIILLFSVRASLRSGRPRDGLALLAFLSVQPGWFLLLSGSFTEPLVVMFLVVAVEVSQEFPILGALIKGVALASKQQALILAMLVFPKVRGKERLLPAVTLGVAAVAFGVGIQWGFDAYIQAVLLPTARTPANPDGISLFALIHRVLPGVLLPSWLAVIASIGATIWLRRRSAVANDFGGAAALFAAFLWFVPFAIWSHWTIVTILLTLAYLRMITRMDDSLESSTPPLVSENQPRSESISLVG